MPQSLQNLLSPKKSGRLLTIIKAGGSLATPVHSRAKDLALQPLKYLAGYKHLNHQPSRVMLAAQDQDKPVIKKKRARLMMIVSTLI
jgi:hypothetical protein